MSDTADTALRIIAETLQEIRDQLEWGNQLKVCELELTVGIEDGKSSFPAALGMDHKWERCERRPRFQREEQPEEKSRG